MDSTCKVWTLKNGRHLRTLTLPCTAFSLTMDRTASHLYAGGSDGRVHVASLSSAANTSIASTSSWHASGNTTAALVSIGMANGSKNLVTCTEDGEVSVWDPASGLLAASFQIGGGAVTDMLVIKKSAAGDMVRAHDGGEGLTVRDGEASRKAGEVAWMEQTLRESEVDKARSVELVEMAVIGGP
ncbi:hypothetical protein E2562_009467 [Oryza meyeriana var. granulata]|uniref:Uncharacterized protein n=1 Tax=Oryza meyeriana var. granulata TaxID=110450 RepID=A0A6G1BU64_9ORYZ|nr:hypothetical protein E2562_009467 [Oryza meyeriana var. granulata]